MDEKMVYVLRLDSMMVKQFADNYYLILNS